MKSTYKIFGEYWDGMPDSESTIINKCADKTIENAFLFSELLSLNDRDNFERIISAKRGGKCAVINIDYWTDSSNPVIDTFLNKRLSQIVSRLRDYYEDVCCVVNEKSPSGATNT